MALTQGYPCFLQEWGKHTWAVAQGPWITLADVAQASDQARTALDCKFFRVRFDRLTPREQDYHHAMAQLGQAALAQGGTEAEQAPKHQKQISANGAQGGAGIESAAGHQHAHP